MPVWRRNLLVWRKLAFASILGNIADPLLYMLALGYGVGSLDGRRRGVIDWNAQGKNLLTPHYQKLAHIRASFPAFTLPARLNRQGISRSRTRTSGNR